MWKIIAPKGEERGLELHGVLTRLVETAEKVERFTCEYKKNWEKGDPVLMQKSLWNCESHFRNLLQDFHCAMEALETLAVFQNHEAKRLVDAIPRIEGSTDTELVRLAVETASQLAGRHLAMLRELEKARIKERPPSGLMRLRRILSAITADIVLRLGVGEFNRQFRKDGLEEKENQRRKAAGFDD